MKGTLKYFLKLFLFILLFFISERIIFLVFQPGLMKGISLHEIAFTFLYGFSMDAASCFAVFLFPLILISIYIYYPRAYFLKISRHYIRLIIILSAFIN